MTQLTDEQKELITDAGRAEISYKDLALITDLSEKEVKEALNNQESEIFKLHRKGKILSWLKICKSLEKQAIDGDRLAAETLLNIRKEIRDRAAIDEYLGKL